MSTALKVHFREIIQTKSVFSAEGVERRGYGGKSGFGSGGGGGGGGVRRTIGEDFQARAPLVSRDRKVWTKQEIKEEEEQAEKALKELYLEDKMATYDKKLFSEPDYMYLNITKTSFKLFQTSSSGISTERNKQNKKRRKR